MHLENEQDRHLVGHISFLRLAFKGAVNAPIWGPPGTHRGDAALSGVLGLLSASLLEVSDKIMDTSIHRESSLAHPQT